MNPQPKQYSYKKPLILGFLSAFVVMGINYLAEFFQIYSGYHWFDIPMHLAGGFTIGLLSIGVVRAYLSAERYERGYSLLFVVVGVLFVGIVWEMLEAYFKVAILYGGNYWFDTIKDLLMDTLGGILSYICFHPHTKKQ